MRLPKAPGEYVRTAALTLAEDTPYAKMGTEICFGQTVEKIEDSVCREKTETNPRIEIVDGDSSFSVKGDGFFIMFQKMTGKLISWNIRGKNWCITWRTRFCRNSGVRYGQRCRK